MPMNKGALAEMQSAPPEDAEQAAAPAEEQTEDQQSPDAAESDGGKELFDLAVARTLDALAEHSKDLDTALKADPVKATIDFGTSALHAVALGADDAGKPIPFEVLVQAGMQVIKELGAIASDKGYLPDDQIEVFLKEAFQQSLAKFAQLDVKAGKVTPEELQQVQAKLGGGQPQEAPQPPAGPGALSQAGGM